MRKNKIPIFPLEVVLLPGLPLPLHIFEERYKEMIRTCLNDRREFGVVYANGNQIRKAGSTARIIDVSRRYRDGKLDIMTRGARRFVINELIDEKSYLEAKVSYFDDFEENDTEEMLKLSREGIELIGKLSSYLGKKQNFSNLNKLNFRVISFLITGIEIISLQQKQYFLELTSTEERLREGVEILKQVLEQTRVIKKVLEQQKPKMTQGGFSIN